MAEIADVLYSDDEEDEELYKTPMIKPHSKLAQLLVGEEISLADATLFPTMVFVTQMLPKFEEVGSNLIRQ